MHHFGVFESADENTRLKVHRLDQAARIETRRKEENNVDEETTKKPDDSKSDEACRTTRSRIDKK